MTLKRTRARKKCVCGDSKRLLEQLSTIVWLYQTINANNNWYAMANDGMGTTSTIMAARIIQRSNRKKSYRRVGCWCSPCVGSTPSTAANFLLLHRLWHISYALFSSPRRVCVCVLRTSHIHVLYAIFHGRKLSINNDKSDIWMHSEIYNISHLDALSIRVDF